MAVKTEREIVILPLPGVIFLSVFVRLLACLLVIRITQRLLNSLYILTAILQMDHNHNKKNLYSAYSQRVSRALRGRVYINIEQKNMF